MSLLFNETCLNIIVMCTFLQEVLPIKNWSILILILSSVQDLVGGRFFCHLHQYSILKSRQNKTDDFKSHLNSSSAK